VSATRSGSTLLRLMLDSHPAMAIPLETHFVPDLIKARRWERADADRLAEVVTTHRRWGDFHLDADELRRRFNVVEPLEIGELVRAFYELYAEQQGKSRWGDKTPGYVREMIRIEHVLPEARFIHLIRDGRDVALSVLGMEWGPDTVEGAARRWKKRVMRGREQAARLPHYLEVRYEDLILDTEPTLLRICEYIELDFDEAMLRYYERAEERLSEKARDLYRGPDRPAVSAEHRMRSHALAKEPPKADRVYRWREKMTLEQRAEFEAEAGDLLADLGYEVEGPVKALTGRSSA
nr:sulfotransferase [Actinomycetota bacterium]